MGKLLKKLADRIAGKKSNPKKAVGIIKGMTPEQREKAMKSRVSGKRPDFSKPRTVLKAAVKPKVLEQTPTGMANSTKSSPYIPPAKKTTKPKL